MVKIDRTKCIGCGACVGVCPDIFQLKDGKAYIKQGKENESCDQAKNICPVQAIL